MNSSAPSEAEFQHSMKDHFYRAYQMFADGKVIPEATFERSNGVLRCLTGTPYPNFNAVLDSSGWEGSWDDCIMEQKKFFGKARIAFVWYVDEGVSIELEKALTRHGFTSHRVLRGVATNLLSPIPPAKKFRGISFEVIKDTKTLDNFKEFFCKCFDLDDKTKAMLKKILTVDARKSHPIMTHWIAKKGDAILSELSTIIKDNAVSLWNGATQPEQRGKGISTALTCLALQDAIDKGCLIGSSCLLADTGAFGILTKLGMQTRWRFRCYDSPPT